MKVAVLFLLALTCLSLKTEHTSHTLVEEFLSKEKEGIFFKIINLIAEIVRDAQVNSQNNGYSLFGVERMFGSIWQNYFHCLVCHKEVEVMNSVLTSRVFQSSLENFAVFFCGFGMDKFVCKGAVHTMISTILNELPEFLTAPKYFCGRVTGACRNPYKVLKPETFIDRVLKEKPQEIKENNYIDTLYTEIK